MSYPGKRALDVAVAGALLTLSAPVLALAAMAIRLETHGHPIYRQRRVGRHGEPFELYKLRTMISGAETMGAGLHDHLRHGTPAVWEAAEGTR